MLWNPILVFRKDVEIRIFPILIDMLVGIRDFQEKLGESRQDGDGWTICNMVNFLKIRCEGMLGN